MPEFCTVLVTAGSEEEAALLARTLVEERLAACCSIVPAVRSFYRWEGAVQDDAESMLIIKSSMDLFPALERRVRDLHSYDVPEVLCFPVRDGSGPYLQWLGESLKPDGGE